MVDFSWTAIGFSVFAMEVLPVFGLLYANGDRLEATLNRCFKLVCNALQRCISFSSRACCLCSRLRLLMTLLLTRRSHSIYILGWFGEFYR